jgi:hypothetical protein
LRGFEKNKDINIKSRHDESNGRSVEKSPVRGQKGPFDVVLSPESHSSNLGVNNPQKPPRPVSTRVIDNEVMQNHKDDIDNEGGGLISSHVNDNYSETSSKNSKKSKSSWSRIKSTLTHTVGSKSKFRKSTDSKVMLIYL